MISAQGLPASSDPLVGQVVQGKYRIRRAIGKGGMGLVYEARHELTGRKVALKVLAAHASISPANVQRFLREAQAAAAVGSEHVVDVLDMDLLDGGSYYLALEHLDGCDLSYAVATARRFPVDRALNVLVQLCDALSAVHAAGIVHRDLKPDNIFLVERRGQPDFVKVLDFGVCTFAASDAERLTASGDAVGTPLFMAPEQLEARHAVDERADIYALGTILFFMLTGEAPFSGSTLLALGSKICHAPPPSLASRGCDAPPELEAILQKALRKKPEARFQTCAELKSAIEEFLGPRSHVADTTLVSVPAPRIVLDESPDPDESTAIPRLAMDRSNLIFTAGLGLVAVAGAAAALVHFVRSDPFPKAIVDGRAGNTSVARIASLHASKAAASASAGVPSAAPSGPSGSPVTAAVGSSDLSSNALPAGPTAELAASSTSVADAAPAASAPAARMRPPASGALSSASGRSSKAERTAAEKRLPAAEESPVSAASTGSVPKATDETKSSAKGDTSSPRDVPPNPNGVSLNHGPKRGL